jgi:hypothetical protein
MPPSVRSRCRICPLVSRMAVFPFRQPINFFKLTNQTGGVNQKTGVSRDSLSKTALNREEIVLE